MPFRKSAIPATRKNSYVTPMFRVSDHLNVGYYNSLAFCLYCLLSYSIANAASIYQLASNYKLSNYSSTNSCESSMLEFGANLLANMKNGLATGQFLIDFLKLGFWPGWQWGLAQGVCNLPTLRRITLSGSRYMLKGTDRKLASVVCYPAPSQWHSEPYKALF